MRKEDRIAEGNHCPKGFTNGSGAYSTFIVAQVTFMQCYEDGTKTRMAFEKKQVSIIEGRRRPFPKLLLLSDCRRHD